MTRTLRSEPGGPSRPRQRAHDHDLEDDASRRPRAGLAGGTPWPPSAVPNEIAELGSAAHERPTPAEPYAFLDEDAVEVDVTEPVPREQLELEALELEMNVEPLRMIELGPEEIGTRTLMGVGARAVRAVATAGWVEARAARRGLSPTPGPVTPRPSAPILETAGPARVIVSPQLWEDGSSRAADGPSVQPPHLQPELLSYPVLPRAALDSIAPAAAGEPAAAAAPGLAPPSPDAPAYAPDERGASGSIGRVLGFAALALVLLAIGMYIGMSGL
jgi:hypothetical protein